MKKQKLYILGIFVVIAIILGVIFRDKIKKWFTGEQYYYIDDAETCMICMEESNYINTEEPNSPYFNINYGPLLEVCSHSPIHKAHNKCIADWIINKAAGQELGNIYNRQDFGFNFNYIIAPELATCPACRENLKLIYYLGVSQFLMNQVNNYNISRIGRDLRGLINRRFDMTDEEISNFKRVNQQQINEIEQNIINFQIAENENIRRNQPQEQQPQEQQQPQPNPQERNENERIINRIEQILPLLRQRNFEDLSNLPNINDMIIAIGNNREAQNYIERLPDRNQLMINIRDFYTYFEERLNRRVEQIQQQMQQRQQEMQQLRQQNAQENEQEVNRLIRLFEEQRFERQQGERIIIRIEQILPLLRQRNFEDLSNLPNIDELIASITNNRVVRNYVERLPDSNQLMINIGDFSTYLELEEILNRRNNQQRQQRQQREQREQQEMLLRQQRLQRNRELEIARQREQQIQQEMQLRQQREQQSQQELEEQRQLRLQREQQIQQQKQNQEKRRLELEQIKQKQELEKQLMQKVVVKKEEKSKLNITYFISFALVFIIVFIIFKNMNKKRK
jgi:hypothetical protein